MKFRLMLPAALLAAFSPAGHALESDVTSTGATLAPIRVNARKATPLTQSHEHRGSSGSKPPSAERPLSRPRACRAPRHPLPVAPRLALRGQLLRDQRAQRRHLRVRAQANA